MSIMTSLDMDPLFCRALSLLHSKSKDSEEQLRRMLDEAIKQRHGGTKGLVNVPIKKVIIEESSDSNQDKRLKSSDVSKSSHLKTSVGSNSSPSSTPSPHLVLCDLQEPDTVKEESLELENDDDDLALEILEEDLTCVVCRGMDVVARNQLVECVECHSLYHQECHQPPVAEADMNDPRSAWYCANCTKDISKMGSASNSGKQASAATGLTSESSSPYSAPVASPGKPSFSSASSKTGTSSSFNVGSKSFGGVPLSSSKHTSAMSKSSSVPSTLPTKGGTANINIINADKRLQIMKKKAAKMQEKRKHSK